MAKHTVRCPQCGASYNIDESKLGKRGRCAKCGNSFTLALPDPSPEEPIVAEVIEDQTPAADSSDEDSENNLQSWGGVVVVLGLLSFLFIGGASEELAAMTVVVIGLCVGAGIWLATKPSVLSGGISGLALTLLGICDLLLAADDGGFGLIAAAVDVWCAINVFIATSKYAKSISEETATATQ